MSESANEQVLREGGGEAVGNIFSKEQVLREGGGEAVENSGGGAPTLPVSDIGVPKTSAPVNPLNLVTGMAMRFFDFPNPLAKAAVVEDGQHAKPSSVISSLPPASSDHRAGGEQADTKHPENKLFSELSASALAARISDKIPLFNKELWISEDMTGAAFLEVVTPSNLQAFIEPFATSFATQLRVKARITKLIAEDNTLTPQILCRWEEFSNPNLTGVPHTPAPIQSIIAPAKLFQTPSASGGQAAVAPGKAFPSFLSEIQGVAGFAIDDSMFFQTPGTTPSSGRVIPDSPQLFSIASPGTAASAPFSITINQPTLDLPKYQILEQCENEDHFYSWLKKNRRETALATPANRRPLTELMSQDCKYNMSRVIYQSNSKDVDIFDKESPYPRRGWCDVTEKLALKVLFKINGPKSATDAKNRLMKKKFYFNDSNTEQKIFTAKLRKHAQDFGITLADFEYSARLWPSHDHELTHFMIIEAFKDNFSSSDTIVGPDGVTHVPRCSNMSIIRAKIAENKAKTLEQIIELLVGHFERLDDNIRANPGAISYPVVPWKRGQENKDKPGKRNFNQVSAGGAASHGPGSGQGPFKKFRPPAAFPRCNNCGSKGHLCGETTCYLFGHPKGRGVNGVWPEGTPSLELNKEEWKAWRGIRHAIFYAYPNNQSKAHGA